MRAALVLALVLTACSPTAAPPSGVGISRDEAIAVAQRHLPGPSVFVSATLGNRAGFVPADPSLINTWIVKFTGDFPRGCPPGGSCPGEAHNATVFVDLSTGEVVSAEYG